jgi:hypothetical protein
LIAPTYIRSAMTADYAHLLVEAGVKVGEVADVVQAILRVVTDDEIDGESLRLVARRRCSVADP